MKKIILFLILFVFLISATSVDAVSDKCKKAIQNKLNSPDVWSDYVDACAEEGDQRKSAMAKTRRKHFTSDFDFQVACKGEDWGKELDKEEAKFCEDRYKDYFCIVKIGFQEIKLHYGESMTVNVFIGGKSHYIKVACPPIKNLDLPGGADGTYNPDGKHDDGEEFIIDGHGGRIVDVNNLTLVDPRPGAVSPFPVGPDSKPGHRERGGSKDKEGAYEKITGNPWPYPNEPKYNQSERNKTGPTTFLEPPLDPDLALLPEFSLFTLISTLLISLSAIFAIRRRF